MFFLFFKHMAEYKFVKELPDDYQCMICAKVLNEPHLTDCCGQHFCQVCLEQWFKKQDKKICPHCRSESFSHISYIPLKRKIDDLEVYCPNQEEGCQVVTKLGDLNSHEDAECSFAKVVCSQGCGTSILRKELTEHCSNECSKRMIKCKYCSKEDHFEKINGRHTTVCKEYPVNCPRGCTLSAGIKRKNLAKHMEICPLERVQCPFSGAGCDIRVLRKDLSDHMEVNTQQHMMKMMTAYSKLKVEYVNLFSEHSKLKEEFEWLSSISQTPTPAKLTIESNSFTFSLTSSSGWSSPPFYILDGYKFCIRHKEGTTIALILLKGENDDRIKWPMDLDYELSLDLTTFSWNPQDSKDSVDYKEKQSFFVFRPPKLRLYKLYEFSRELTEITLPWVLNSKSALHQITVNYKQVEEQPPVNLDTFYQYDYRRYAHPQLHNQALPEGPEMENTNPTITLTRLPPGQGCPRQTYN